jgi:hypothetical protein
LRGSVRLRKAREFLGFRLKPLDPPTAGGLAPAAAFSSRERRANFKSCGIFKRLFLCRTALRVTTLLKELARRRSFAWTDARAPLPQPSSPHSSDARGPLERNFHKVRKISPGRAEKNFASAKNNRPAPGKSPPSAPLPYSGTGGPSRSAPQPARILAKPAPALPGGPAGEPGGHNLWADLSRSGTMPINPNRNRSPDCANAPAPDTACQNRDGASAVAPRCRRAEKSPSSARGRRRHQLKPSSPAAEAQGPRPDSTEKSLPSHPPSSDPRE